MRLPAKETITNNGSAAIALDEVRDALDQPMRAMRQCLASLPASAFQVTITKVGPRSPQSRDRPVYRLPTPDAKVAPILSVGERAGDNELAAAGKCLDIEVTKLKLPTPKDKDTWYMMSFLVVGP
jgi:hypothetical protein